MLDEALHELLDLYRAGIGEHLTLMLALFAAPLLAGGAWWRVRAWQARRMAATDPGEPVPRRAADPRGLRELARRDLPLAAVLGGLTVGVLGALRKASLVDDAYISFRFSRNFAEGHGLVWNVGERVEGYTNFLWTWLLGVLDWATPMGPAHGALVLSLLVLAGNLLVAWRLGWQLSGRHAQGPRTHVPLAVVVLSLHSVFTVYGTTGLETGFACLWVQLGLYFLVSRDDWIGSAAAGSMWILAALTRPDHGLFYAVGGLVLLVARAKPAWGARGDGVAGLWREAGRHLLAYAAPFSVYLGYLAWKISFYGQILPNTYYAKSAYETWWDQGIIYAASFLVGTHAWVLVLCCAVSLLVRPASERVRRFQLFGVGAVVVYGLYVTRVGGDFMYGRFFVVLLPMLLLGSEAWLHDLAHHALRRGRFPWEGLAVAGLVLATIPAVTICPKRAAFMGIAEEHTAYPIRSFSPLRVAHAHFKVGNFYKKKFVNRGVEPVIATGGIGMVGYYSGLRLIDVRGLTDPVVAMQDVEVRGRPGHEKEPPDGYLVEQGVHFARMRAGQFKLHPREYRQTARIHLGPLKDPWQIVYYDRELMRRVDEEVPEVRFVDFEAYLDNYIATINHKAPAGVARDLAWFRAYYFDHNDDPARLQAIEGWLTAPVMLPSPADAGTGAPPPNPDKVRRSKEGRSGTSRRRPGSTRPPPWSGRAPTPRSRGRARRPGPGTRRWCCR